jgi:RHS repeat-associated protein
LPGQYHDEETGLHYNGARYYDPDVGRFTSPDPLALHGGLNTYRYAPNPINWIDPYGLKCGKKHRYITYVVKVPSPNGPVVYVGRASGPHGMSDADILKNRQGTHRSKNPNRTNWELELDRGGLTYNQARGREQLLFDTHGGQPRPRGSDPHAANVPNPNNSKLLNIDNPISPENENRKPYLRAGRGV